MKYRFFTILRAVAALLFAAVLLLWLRLAVTGERPALYVHLPRERIRVDIDGRKITFLVSPGHSWEQGLSRVALYDINPLAGNLRWSRSDRLDAQDGDHWSGNLANASILGFSYSGGGGPFSYYYSAAMCPTWFVVLLFGLPLIPMIWGFRRLRLRVNQRLCVQCGYDLRASGDRCPECGTANLSTDAAR